VLAQTRSYGKPDGEATEVPLASIIASPASYDGQRVRTYGTATIGFENNALYVDRKYIQELNARNAVWLDFNIRDVSLSGLAVFDLQYIVVEGRVDARERGHRDRYSATLADVNFVAGTEQ
jgi:hypothetical protein